MPLFPPPWKTVCRVFRKWTLEGTWESLNSQLRAKVRKTGGKRTRPTGAILDSQSATSDSHGVAVGHDAAKRITGRKRHLLVDTLGLLWGIEITPASTPEREGAQTWLKRVLKGFSWLKLMWVNGGYTGEKFARWVRSLRPQLKTEVVKRSDSVSGFELLPRRSGVERTFGWPATTQPPRAAPSPPCLAMIRIPLRRLA